MTIAAPIGQSLDVAKYLEMLKQERKRLLADPKAAREAMVRAGIWTKSGKLATPYR